MATTVRELLVKLGVQTDDARLRKFGAGLTSVRRAMLSAAGAATAMAGSIAAAVLLTARQGDEAAKAGKRIGVAAEDMQAWGFAAEQAGSSLGDLERALKAQARTASEAAAGTGEALESYKRLGVSTVDAKGKQKDQIVLLGEIADGLAKVGNAGEEAALAQDIFGRAGTALLPMLRQGSAEIEKQLKLARDLGYVMSEEDTRAAEDLTDRLNELRKIIVGLRNRVGLAFMPTITHMIERFRDWFVANRAIIDQRLDVVIDNVRYVIERLGLAIEEVDRRVKEGPGSWGEVFRQVAKMISVGALVRVFPILITLISGLGAGIGMLLSPVGLLVIGVAALLLALDDLIVFLRGGDSALGDFLAQFDRAEAVFETAWRLIDAGTGLVSALAGVLHDLAVAIGGPVVEALLAVMPAFLTWERILRAIDALVLTFVLHVEERMQRAADAIELVTLALTDLRAFGAEVFGRVGDFAGGLARGTATLAEGAAGLPGRGGVFGVGGRLTGGGAFNLAAEAAGALSARFGPRPEMRGVPSSNTVNQAGDTISISTVASPEEIATILDRRDRKRRIAAAAAIRGGDR